MALTRDQKVELVKKYVEDIKKSSQVIVIKQLGIDGNMSVDMRKSIAEVGAKFMIVKKRLFFRAIKETGLQDVALEEFEGSIMALYMDDEEMKALKEINKFVKKLKKTDSELKYLGGWFEKDWKDGEYIDELANVPSKEELVGKFVYLLNYPVQSFAYVLKMIAEKNQNEKPKEEEEKKEQKDGNKEEGKKEIKEEIKEQKEEKEEEKIEGEKK